MPDCIGDEKLLKRTLKENRKLIKIAESKIYNDVKKLKMGEPSKEGLNVFYHVAGLLGQRLWFYGKTSNYTDRLKIKKSLCIGCGKCVSLCPMENLRIFSGKAVPSNRCTMCYRCINRCPTKAITLLGKKVYEQCRVEKYV